MGKLKELIESKIQTTKEVQDTLSPEVTYKIHPVDPFTFIGIMEELGVNRDDLKASQGQLKLPADKLRILFLRLLELGVDDWEPGLEKLVPHMIMPLGTKILEMSTYSTFPAKPPRLYAAELGEAIQSQDIGPGHTPGL